MENIEILKLKDRHRIIKEHNFNTMAEVEAYRKAIDDYKSKQLTLTDVVKRYRVEAIAMIGGSGVYEIDGLENASEVFQDLKIKYLDTYTSVKMTEL